MASCDVASNSSISRPLIEIELRSALTKHAHKRYMAANNFYRTAVLREGGLDNVDQRIVADIDAFSKEAAFLYGGGMSSSPAILPSHPLYIMLPMSSSTVDLRFLSLSGDFL
jgi:ABC-type uncharacterized transport system fused permease/ATPase subunit